jgi:hypothetical protein
MQHILRSFVFLFFTIIIFSSCAIFITGYSEYKSAKRFYQERNYDQAALYASRSLKLKTKNKKALTIFENSYQLGVEEHKSNIKNLEKIEDGSKWPKLFYEYNALQNLSDELVSLKPIIKVKLKYNLDLPLQDYNEELNRIRPLAADYHYTRGLEYREDKGKESQKSAAKAFKSAQQFVPNYINSKELYDETRAAATITLLIRPFKGNRNLVDYIRDQMMMTQTNTSKEFLQIITRDQLSTILHEQGLVQSGITENNYMEVGQLSGADQILSASLTTTYRPSETISIEDIKQEKKVVIRTEKYVDDEGVEKTKKIKKKVYATINHYKKSAGSSLLLTYRITDVKSGQMFFSGTVNTDANFFHEWATYEGDKRALSSQYGRLVIREEQFAPSRSELYMKAAGKLPNQLMQTISDHYSN